MLGKVGKVGKVGRRGDTFLILMPLNIIGCLLYCTYVLPVHSRQTRDISVDP